MTRRSHFLLSAGLVLPWLGTLVVLLIVLLGHVPPTGTWQKTFPFDGSSLWLATFLPSDRVTAPGPQPDGWNGQRIFAEPVYASGRVPIVADTASLALEARITRQPLIEIGATSDAPNDSIEARPVWSSVLASGWRRVVLGSDVGYVRNGVPDQALQSAPFDQTLVWHGSSTPAVSMDAPSITRTFPMSLRGSHDLYFIPTKGTNRFAIQAQDMNRVTGGSSNLTVRLLLDDKLIWTDVLALPARTDRVASPVFVKTLEFNELKAGVYRLAFAADDDVFIRSIETNTRQWVIGPRLSVGDQVGFSTTTMPLHVWTNSQHLSLQTYHREGLQTVHFGQAEVALKQAFSVYRLSRSPNERIGDQTLDAPAGDVQIFGDGFFAFEPEASFLPKPRRLTDQSDPMSEGITVIKTPYLPPEVLQDGWVRLSATVPLAKETNRLRWTLGLPGITTRNGSVDIRGAQLTYTRRPLRTLNDWKLFIRREAAAAWHRL